MEIRFTASIIIATECALRLAWGQLHLLPKGSPVEYDHWVKLEAPEWCNFSFFGRIVASPIRRVERFEPSDGRPGVWKLEREVEFYYQGHRVAVVTVVGQKTDGRTVHPDNDSAWAVTKLGYFRTLGWTLSDPPKDWREFEREVISLTTLCAV